MLIFSYLPHQLIPCIISALFTTGTSHWCGGGAVPTRYPSPKKAISPYLSLITVPETQGPHIYMSGVPVADGFVPV